MNSVLTRQRQNAVRRQVREREFKTGACAGGCGCAACPGNGESMTINRIAEMLGNREVVGVTGRCKYNMLHLANANKAAGLAVGVSETITIPNVQFGLCVQQIVMVGREVAIPGNRATFELSNFMIGNKPQWIQGQAYNSNMFRFNSECSCCLPGDCTSVGITVSMVATNRSALASNIDVYLIGPATS